MAVELNKWELVSTDDKTGTRLLKQFCSETEIEYKLETRNRDALGVESWSSVYDMRANNIYAYKRVDEIDQRMALFGLCRMAASEPT